MRTLGYLDYLQCSKWFWIKIAKIIQIKLITRKQWYTTYFPLLKHFFYPQFYLLKVYQPDFLPLLQPLRHCEEAESLSQQPARNSLISDPSSDPCWARAALTTRYSLLPTPCAGKPQHKFFFSNNMTWKQTKQRFLKIPIMGSWNLSVDAHTDKKYLKQM